MIKIDLENLTKEEFDAVDKSDMRGLNTNDLVW